MTYKELTCIRCPLGCIMQVAIEGDEIKEVKGNTCKRGDDYARKEITSPMRIVTSTVEVDGTDDMMLSVKTEKDIPKGTIMDCMKALKGIKVSLPVHIGDVIIENVAGTGVSIIATKTIEVEKI